MKVKRTYFNTVKKVWVCRFSVLGPWDRSGGGQKFPCPKLT